MTIDEFVKKYDGKEVKWGGYSQCVALYRQYIHEVLGFPQSPGVAQGAKQIWENYRKENFIKIPNTPSGIPQKGDVMIWKGTASNKWGHVAICLSGDVNRFVSFDQNYPMGSNCRKVTHSYKNLFGWIRPILEDMPMTKITPPVCISTKGTLDPNVDHIDITHAKELKVHCVLGGKDFTRIISPKEVKVVDKTIELKERIVELEDKLKALQGELETLSNELGILIDSINLLLEKTSQTEK